MDGSIKNEVIRLRKLGKTYNEIKSITGLSKAGISYHCKRTGIGGRIDGKGIENKDVNDIKKFRETHTVKETCNAFNIGVILLRKIIDKKIYDTEIKKTGYDYVKSLRNRNKIKGIEYKGGKCSICGYDKCNSALDFHHLDQTKKDFTISSNMNRAWSKIKIELDKCILVCANCHREIHENLHKLGDIPPV